MSLEDNAQDYEAKEWAARNAPRPERPTYAPGDAGYGPEECDQCDGAVHPVRRANGWRLCTPCQSAREIVTARLAR
jgi:hypothetical protein